MKLLQYASLVGDGLWKFSRESYDVWVMLASATNYQYLVCRAGACVGVDCIDVGFAQRVVEERALTLNAVLTTHHHRDHSGGNAAWRQLGIPTWGSGDERANNQHVIGDGTTLGGMSVEAYPAPCHTQDHLLYKIGPLLFTGDTLFSAGCGRFFEGTPAEMLRAMALVRRWPDASIFAGHEYTLANLKWARAWTAAHGAPPGVELPSDLTPFTDTCTMPTTLEFEKKVNLFLNAKNEEEMKQLREHKDAF